MIRIIRFWGALLYRADRLEEAVDVLKTSAEEEVNIFNRTYTHYFLAMAHHRLGHAVEAKKWFQRAVTQTEKQVQNESTLWNRRLTLQLLRKEAAALIGQPDALTNTDLSDPHR